LPLGMRPAPLLAGLLALVCALTVPAAARTAGAGSPAVRVASASACHGSPAAIALCRMNATRRAYGLRPLRRDPLLRRAARQKAHDMVARHYFDHVSPTGQTLRGRVAGTGWTRGRDSWRLGENLAWGAGSNSSPAALVRAWLRSPPHRRIMLSPSYRVVGVGHVPATPFGAAGATLVADFGS